MHQLVEKIYSCLDHHWGFVRSFPQTPADADGNAQAQKNPI